MRAVRALIVAGLAVAVASVALAGCGGGGTPSACGLVTDDEAARILDTPTRPGEPDDDDEGPGSNCAWISTDSTEDPEAAVYGVHLWLRDDADARAEFDRRRDRASDDVEIVPVPGLGDAAYRVEYTEPNGYTGTPSLPELYVRAGDRVLGVGTFDSDERPVTVAEARGIEAAAARAALARL